MSQRLSALFVKRVSEPGKYHDEHGLILRVKPTGSKQWVQRLVVKARRRDIGLGGYPLVSLAEAREAAFLNRKLARAGGDPLAMRRRPDVPTFEDASKTVIALHAENWKDSGRTAALWESSLCRYAFPRLGHRLVSDITVADVMAVLVADDFWHHKRETAKKVRRRISTIMKWAVAQGFREANPAGEVLGAALPKNTKAVEHYAAVPHAEVVDAIGVIRASSAAISTKLALEFLILTATRSGEVRGMVWGEVDLDDKVWTVPADRTKTGKPHRVPLSTKAVAVLREAEETADGSGLVFPSARGRVMSDSTLSKLMRENAVAGTPHGFRSSFRDWVSECTNTPREVAEAALAHVVRSQVEAAYARSDLFDKRRKLMDQWASYLSGDHATVVQLHG